MIYNYEDTQAVDEENPQDDDNRLVPDFDSEYISAKAFLQKCSTFTGDNLYDHLTDVLNKILAERPENVIDFFEEYSRKVKEKRFKPLTDHLEDIFVPTARYELASKLLPLLRPPPEPEASTLDPEDEEIVDMTKNDMLQLLYYLEQVGIGLQKTEMFALMLSIRQLVKKQPVSSLRFWGKIYGLYKNYLVLEAELKDEEIAKRNELQEMEEEKAKVAYDDEPDLGDALKDIAQDQEFGEDKSVKQETKCPRPLPPPPKIVFDEQPEAPVEGSGEGVNKKIYFVCNEVGDSWIELPNVTPKEIQVARKIVKAFTGNLEEEILTYPDFPGTEKNYLRAQIARISAGTQISPLGFFTFGGGDMGEEEEEEEAEEEEPGGGGKSKTTYNVNKRYEPPPLRDLLDNSMSFWVHHTLYILPQGRTSWWNPYPHELGEEVDEEMGEEEEAEKPKTAGAEPETGPPLLTPLSEDASLEAVPPWSVRLSSNLTQDYAVAMVRSNLWPGAYCFTTQGKLFQNVYFGYGLKYMSQNFSPFPLPPVQQDYPIGPEIMEVDDPTGAEEEQWRIAHLPKPKPDKQMMGEEGEENEEEEEEEDEEDD